MTLILIVLLPFLMAALPRLAGRAHRRRCALLAACAPALSLALLLAHAPAVFDGTVLQAGGPWLPAIGLNFTFMLDGFGFLFALLILAIGLLVILYAHYYLSAQDDPSRFFCLLLLFMGSMLGVVLSDNLLLLVVFWECTSLSSFLLIGFWRDRSEARQGARMALAVTGAGGLALLAGVLLIGYITGSFELSEVLDQREMLQGHPLFPLALILVLLGAFTKSAQFPFHFWLPHAMAAPTPVSAYLHSATMVKAGVFLLARMYPLLGGNDLWFLLVTGVGLVTLVFAAWVALFQQDLKGLLAYSTISHLGLITLLFGLDTPLAVVAGVFHIINHATFKASLFMAAGIIDHETGTRDLRRLNGLARYMPVTATLVAVAAAAMAGVPLLNGFLSKEMLLAKTVAIDTGTWADWLIPVMATLAGAFAVAYSLRLVHDVFFNGEPVGLERTPHEPPRWMRVPVELLVVLCVLVGVMPNLLVAPLLDVAVSGVLLGNVPEYSISLWHGFNLPLAMSVVALLLGSAIYFGLQGGYNLHLYRDDGVSAKRLFDRLLETTVSIARLVTGGMQNGSLQRYLWLMVAVTLAAGALPFFLDDYSLGDELLLPTNGAAIAMWLAVVAATVATVALHRRRLLSLIAVGAVGLLVSLTFVLFSAPDLALTQLSVEVVTVVLLMVALRHLPATTPVEGSLPRHLRDALLALAAGIGMAALAYAALTRPLASISTYFLEQSVPKGGGSNVVNVILVDFRSFDTLVEILVLAVAGLTIHALLSGFAAPGRGPVPDPHEARPLMLRVLARLILPFALAASVYLFLRGHNEPGGGFVAGLVTAIALLVQYMASGRDAVPGRAHAGAPGPAAPPGEEGFDRWIAAGMFSVGLTGLGAVLIGFPFLTSSYAYFDLPLLGKVPLASAMFFDVGVYLTVVGSTMMMLASIGRVTTVPGQPAGPTPPAPDAAARAVRMEAS
ncbi:MAG: monovalent cation/H+ antiporter subunit A [Burkholderiales bacterium]|nr:monovalent cation/H+ antiporter subunit A [Burkholderiales bacterium]